MKKSEGGLGDLIQSMLDMTKIPVPDETVAAIKKKTAKPKPKAKPKKAKASPAVSKEDADKINALLKDIQVQANTPPPKVKKASKKAKAILAASEEEPKIKVSPLKAALDAMSATLPSPVFGSSWSTGFKAVESDSSGGYIQVGNVAAFGTSATTTTTTTTVAPGPKYILIDSGGAGGTGVAGIGDTATYTSYGGGAYVAPPVPPVLEKKPELETPCAFCHGTTRMVWNAFKHGPLPPPANWVSSHNWMWDFGASTSTSCPACTPRGWGEAFNGPWSDAYKIANKIAPYNLLNSKGEPNGGFVNAMKHVIHWYNNAAAAQCLQADLALRDAKRAYFLGKLMRDHRAGQDAPDWEPYTGAQCECGGFNLGPATHPRTFQKGVGCCECGKAWVTGPPTQPTDKEVDVLRWSLRNLGFSDATVEDLLATFNYHELNDFGAPGNSREDRLPDLR